MTDSFVVHFVGVEEVKEACKHDKRLLVSPTALNFALDVNGVTVAYVSVTVIRSKVLRVTLAFTLLNQRHKGYGGRLLLYVEQMMKKQYPSLEKIEVCALLESIGFYSRLGFQILRYKKYKVADVAYMERPIKV